jgi:hypothetical protein
MNDSVKNAASYVGGGTLVRHRRDQDADRSAAEILERGVDLRAALRVVEVEGHLLEAVDRLWHELGSQRDNKGVVVQISRPGAYCLALDVDLLDLVIPELDPFPLQAVQGPAELVLAALPHDLPEQRWLVDMVL